MRKDVAALLDKLNRNDFRYRQFADPIADLEPWPLFTALLADPRIIGRPEPVAGYGATQPGGTFLKDYGDTRQGAGRDEPVTGSLQSFLSGLSDAPVEGR